MSTVAPAARRAGPLHALLHTQRGHRQMRITATYILLVPLVFFVLFPFLWMLSTSLKAVDEVRTVTPSLVPNHPTLENFDGVLSGTLFLTYFRNSLVVATATTVCGLVVSCLAGYAFSALRRAPGLGVLAFSMFVAQMVPPVLLVLPLYTLMLHLHLLNTYGSMIIAYTTFAIPFCTWMLKSYFDSLPREIDESALVDGCTRTGVLFRIVLPIALPGLIATGLFCFVLAWNEFLFGYTFVSTDSVRTLTPGISLFMGLWTTNWGYLMAASVMAIVPIAIAFAFLQRYMVQGLTGGAVKG